MSSHLQKNILFFINAAGVGGGGCKENDGDDDDGDGDDDFVIK